MLIKLFKVHLNFLFIYINYIIFTNASELNEVPQINLPLGRIEGVLKKTIDGKKFYGFEGIPYAKPPIENRRFREPEEVESWTGIWKANTIYRCLQHYHSFENDPHAIFGEENCLYLNIYTPTLNTSANLDVIFYIPGGAFMFSYAGRYGPEILLNENIIFVSINYRLGIFGFLSTEDELAPGNNGLRDQILGLKFVKKYIQHFGGNPNSITLAGNSAGGASVHLHYMIPESRDLFTKGISMSGSALNPWILMERPLEKVRIVANENGCPTNSSKEILDCLRTRNGRQLVQTVKNTLQPWLYNPFSPFAVVVDKWAKSPLFSVHPFKLLQKGQIKKAPWLISLTNSEGLYPGVDFYDDNYLEIIDKNWNQLMPYILHYNETIQTNKKDNVSKEIRQFYLKEKKVNKDSFTKLIQCLSDRLFNNGIEESIRLQSKATNQPIYSYYFSYRGTHSQAEILFKNGSHFGAAHADDLMYLTYMFKDTYSNKNDRKVSNLLVKIWSSYIKSKIPRAGNLEFPSIKRSDKEISYIAIPNGDNIEIKKTLEFGKNAFWDNLNLEENSNLFKRN